MWKCGIIFVRGGERKGERECERGGEQGNARGVNGEHAWGGEQGTWGEHVSLRMS